jgi:hypothetical protein
MTAHVSTFVPDDETEHNEIHIVATAENMCLTIFNRADDSRMQVDLTLEEVEKLVAQLGEALDDMKNYGG